MSDNPTLDEIASQMYGDFLRHVEYGDMEWDGGTLRPWDYESRDSVEDALSQWAPLVTSTEATASFKEPGTKVLNGNAVEGEVEEISYDVSHITLDSIE